jgi:hypothetical protein
MITYARACPVNRGPDQPHQHQLPEPLKASIGTLWRLGRSLLAIVEELEKRPRGRFYHRAIGMLPVVGMAGDYLGERSGLKRVAKRAQQWFVKQGELTART